MLSGCHWLRQIHIGLLQMSGAPPEQRGASDEAALQNTPAIPPAQQATPEDPSVDSTEQKNNKRGRPTNQSKDAAKNSQPVMRMLLNPPTVTAPPKNVSEGSNESLNPARSTLPPAIDKKLLDLGDTILQAAADISESVSHSVTSAQILFRGFFKKQMEQLQEEHSKLVQLTEKHTEAVKALEQAKRLNRDREWMAQNGKGKRVCVWCTTHHHMFKHPKQINSPWVAANGGVEVGSLFSQVLFNHETSQMHADSAEMEEARQENIMCRAVDTRWQEILVTTERLMRTAIQGVKKYRAFLDYESIVHLQHSNGVELRDQQHGRQAAAEMLAVFYEDELKQMNEFLSSPNEFTGELPHVGEAADKVCDTQFGQWQVVNGRVNFRGRPVTFLMDLIKMLIDATGASCWDEILPKSHQCRAEAMPKLLLRWRSLSSRPSEWSGITNQACQASS